MLQTDAAEAYVAEFGGTMSSLAALRQEVADGAIEPALLRSHVHEDGERVESDMEMNHEHSQ